MGRRAAMGARWRAPMPTRWRARRATRTIRLRLTALYGSVFLVFSAGLLTIGYLVARSTLREHHPLHEAIHRLGLHPRGLLSGHSPEAQLIRAVSASITDATLHRLLGFYVIALVVMTAIAVVTGWLLAGRALAPLRKITSTARRVSGENLGERIDLDGPDDELKELADTFDGMLARLDGAFASQRRFVANASHELRTPLAIMRTEVDVALADPAASVDELRAMGEAVRETVDRCERLIASLLLLARSEATTGREEPVDIAALAGDVITDMRAHGEEAQVDIRSRLQPAWVDGDLGLLERLIANLLDNALRYNEPGGHVSVATQAHNGGVRLVVSNGGERLDPADVAELTQPFRRLHRSVAGFGLGLSIVDSIAAAHHGTATLAARPTGGLEVTIEFPGRRPEAEGAARPVRVEALRTSS
jgi:signal transduction histidine kinase